MVEEIKFLDEELRNLTTELKSEIARITKTLSEDTRKSKLNLCQDRLNRAADVLHSFRVELRDVQKAAGRLAFIEYDAKGKAHEANVKSISADLEAVEQANAKTRSHSKEEYRSRGTGLIEQGKEVQFESCAALSRCAYALQQMEEVAHDTNVRLKQQSDAMKGKSRFNLRF